MMFSISCGSTLTIATAQDPGALSISCALLHCCTPNRNATGIKPLPIVRSSPTSLAVAAAAAGRSPVHSPMLYDGELRLALKNDGSFSPRLWLALAILNSLGNVREILCKRTREDLQTVR